MRLGFDFELREDKRRSENYVRPVNSFLENEPHAQKTIPENENHAQKTIPENENHAQKTIPENETHAQKTIPENGIDHFEKIDTEWSAICSMLKVAHICEDIAKRYRNLGDFDMEELYLTEANHAQEAAYLLYILTHK